jgi:hypothetical protein
MRRPQAYQACECLFSIETPAQRSSAGVSVGVSGLGITAAWSVLDGSTISHRLPAMEFHVTAAAQSGWLGIGSGDWLSAITNATAIVIALLIAAKIGPKAEERRARRDQQERLLRILISTSPMPANPEYQGAIGLIPIDFKGNERILGLRTEYLALVNEPVPAEETAATKQFERFREKQSDLIAAIAQALDFDLTRDGLLKGTYVSKGFTDREELLLEAMRSWPKIAIALELNNHMFAQSLGLLSEQQRSPSGESGEGQPPVED